MASSRDFVPRMESKLDEFVQNFDQRITAQPAVVGLVAAQCTTFHTLVVAWDSAYALTKVRGTRSSANVIVKNEKKKAMVANLRQLAGIVQKYPGTTNELRSLLGLTVPATRQRKTVPQVAPGMQGKGVTYNTAKVRFYDALNPTRRSKPADAALLQVFTYVGPQPPDDSKDWFFEGVTDKTTLDVVFDAALPIGTKAWICGAWANVHGQAGPACPGMEVTLLGSGSLPTTATGDNGLSIAA